jgi:hypothetical protein
MMSKQGKLASVVIQEGMDDYRNGWPVETNPYPRLEHTELYAWVEKYVRAGHFNWKVVEVQVRVAIDYAKLWEIGWSLAEMIELRQAS